MVTFDSYCTVDTSASRNTPCCNSTRTIRFKTAVGDCVSCRSSSSSSSIGRSRSTETIVRNVSDKTSTMSGTKGMVPEAVDCEIEIGVQVCQHGRVQVNGQRQSVRAVIEQHDDVRAPAADEHNEDDEDSLYLANGLHRCHVP